MPTSKNSFTIALTALEINKIDSVAIMAIKKCQAADELLEALQFYVSVCGNTCAPVSRGTANEMYAAAIAAIAKATA